MEVTGVTIVILPSAIGDKKLPGYYWAPITTLKVSIFMGTKFSGLYTQK